MIRTGIFQARFGWSWRIAEEADPHERAILINAHTPSRSRLCLSIAQVLVLAKAQALKPKKAFTPSSVVSTKNTTSKGSPDGERR
jgi:hypothetical protein